MAVIVSKQIVVPKLVRKKASDYAVGEIVKIKENGTPVEYLVVHQGLPGAMYDASCDGCWVLRKDIAEKRVWAANNVNKLETSDIQAYLNGAWLDRYNVATKAAIKQVKIPYRQNGGSGGTDQTGANGLSCKVFPLSGYEVGWTTSTNSFFPVDGAKLSFFVSGNDSAAMQKRVAKLNGSATLWWPRSPVTSSTGAVWYVRPDGDYGSWGAEASMGVRPALILRSDTLFDSNDILKG